MAFARKVAVYPEHRPTTIAWLADGVTRRWSMTRQGAHSRRPGVVLVRAANRRADLADLCPARRWRVYTMGGKYSILPAALRYTALTLKQRHHLGT